MTITIGDTFPSITLKRLGDDGLEEFNTADALAGRKVVLFAVPGAFTPSCHQKHMPGYLANLDAFKAQGVDAVICLAVNDPFVAKHWSEVSGATGKIDVWPDGNATLVTALGLSFDGSGAGLATRAKRFSMILENAVVTSLDVEDVPSQVELSSADTCLVKLKA
ncbi:MAG: peroxiredoxin [Pseudomonadota bacterium]